jgi:Trypsin-like peptidase domain
MADELETLTARVERSFQGRGLSEVLERYRAVVGPSNSHERLVQEALTALHNGVPPTPRQLSALERAIRVFRPSLVFIKGEVGDLPTEATAVFPEWRKFQHAVKPFLYAIGRIDKSGEETEGVDEKVGTGFLVAETLLLTNRHVLWELSGGTGKLERGQAVVRFGQEYKTRGDQAAVAIIRTVAWHRALDLALLEIERPKARAASQPLKLETRPLSPGEAVVVVGYPFPDTIRNPLFVKQVYGDKYGIKRASPGEITDTEPPSVYHDCTTLGGNSGSPLLAMDTAGVVAVHGCGGFATRNEAVAGDSANEFMTPYVD